jgi:hypothetical protein
MEWALLLLVAAAAAAYVAWPREDLGLADGSEVEALRARRSILLRELAEFDDDLAAGRISEEDRHRGRRALAPELRAVTEELDARGERREAGS